MHREQTVPTEDVQGAERVARHLTRGTIPIDVVEKVECGGVRVRTPPDPRAGLVGKILDPLDVLELHLDDGDRRPKVSLRGYAQYVVATGWEAPGVHT